MVSPLTDIGDKIVSLKANQESSSNRIIRLTDIAYAIYMSPSTFSKVIHIGKQHIRPSYQFIVTIVCFFECEKSILRELELMLIDEWGGTMQIGLGTVRAVDALMDDMPDILKLPYDERLNQINARLEQIFPDFKGIAYIF